MEPQVLAPLPVISVRLMMMSRMNSMLLSTADHPTQCLFTGETSPYSQRQEQDVSTLLHQNNKKVHFSLHELIVFYEQASSHTL